MLLTPKQIGELSGFSASQIRRFIAQGMINAEKIGNFYAINESEIKRIERRRSPNGTRKSANVGKQES